MNGAAKVSATPIYYQPAFMGSIDLKSLRVRRGGNTNRCARVAYKRILGILKSIETSSC
jgi:hypothetical protein